MVDFMEQNIPSKSELDDLIGLTTAVDCGISQEDLNYLIQDYPWLDGASHIHGTVIKIILKLVKDVAELKK